MRTPESLVQRSDSKNPATTCRGITTGGKPCRRSLTSSSSPKSSPEKQTSRGVVAVHEDGQGKADSADFYCFQHKDQAQNNASAAGQAANTTVVPVEGRTSIDSLVARLGLASIQEDATPTKKPREPRKKPTQSQSTYQEKPSTKPSASPSKPKPKPGFWASLCCASSHDTEDDYLEVVRHKQRIQPSRPQPETTQNSPAPLIQQPSATKPRPQNHYNSLPLPNKKNRHADSTTGLPPRKPLLDLPSPSLNQRRTVSAPNTTGNLLNFIPPNLPPHTSSLLLAELSKPISPHDEAGYIYIFWLTDESCTPPPSSAASSLLSPPSAPRQRAVSDLMRSYSTRAGNKDNNKNTPQKQTTPTIKLKIGRANNVHRRMNEWTRQCGYNLSLVRFYPYISSSPANSPVRPTAGKKSGSDQGQVHMVPHAHRVERLIHLELKDQRVIKDCEACGKEHREWFEIEATQEGVKAVDEVVRRWVRWAESTPKDV